MAADYTLLKDIKVANFRVMTGGLPAGGDPEIVKVDVDLTDNAVPTATASTDAEVLAAFVKVLNAALSAYSIAAPDC